MPQLLGQKLRHLRAQRDMTQADLAAVLPAASQAHISNLETGRFSASIELVTQLAEALNVTTDYLLRDNIEVEALDHGLRPDTSPSLTAATFADNLRDLRRSTKLTQRQLANLLGLTSHVHISQLETGRKTPSLELVVRLADALEVATDRLLSREQPETCQ